MWIPSRSHRQLVIETNNTKPAEKIINCRFTALTRQLRYIAADSKILVRQKLALVKLRREKRSVPGGEFGHLIGDVRFPSVGLTTLGGLTPSSSHPLLRYDLGQIPLRPGCIYSRARVSVAAGEG